MAAASEGQKNLRNRLQSKKSRLNEQSNGVQRHYAALNEMKNRKTNNLVPIGKSMNMIGRNRGGEIGYKGAASGIKTNNKYMQDFEKLKSGHKKKCKS